MHYDYDQFDLLPIYDQLDRVVWGSLNQAGIGTEHRMLP